MRRRELLSTIAIGGGALGSVGFARWQLPTTSGGLRASSYSVVDDVLREDQARLDRLFDGDGPIVEVLSSAAAADSAIAPGVRPSVRELLEMAMFPRDTVVVVQYGLSSSRSLQLDGVHRKGGGHVIRTRVESPVLGILGDLTVHSLLIWIHDRETTVVPDNLAVTVRE